MRQIVLFSVLSLLASFGANSPAFADAATFDPPPKHKDEAKAKSSESKAEKPSEKAKSSGKKKAVEKKKSDENK